MNPVEDIEGGSLAAGGDSVMRNAGEFDAGTDRWLDAFEEEFEHRAGSHVFDNEAADLDTGFDTPFATDLWVPLLRRRGGEGGGSQDGGEHGGEKTAHRVFLSGETWPGGARFCSPRNRSFPRAGYVAVLPLVQSW